MKIIKVLLFSSFIAASSFVLADRNKDNFEDLPQYPIPKDLRNWEGNYNPTSVEDYRKYYKFLALKYNSSDWNAEKRSIVREQNRAKNYSAANYDKKIIINRVIINGQ